MILDDKERCKICRYNEGGFCLAELEGIDDVVECDDFKQDKDYYLDNLEEEFVSGEFIDNDLTTEE